MRISFYFTVIVAAAVLALPATALGQREPAAQAWQLLRQAEAERDREQRLRRQRQLSPAHTTPEAAPPPPSDGLCRRVQGLRLRGNHLLSDRALQHAAEPHVTECMDTSALNRLLSALTTAYVNAGYITARPYLLPVPDEQGALQVTIIEGQVEGFEVTDPDLPLSLDNAFGDLMGLPLHLPTLERGMDQLNRLRVFDLASDIRPGATPGGSKVVVRPLSYPPRAWATVTVANNGLAESGRYRWSAQYRVDSPLGWNDVITASLGHTLARDRRFNRHIGLAYAVPRGPWQLTAATSGFSYRSRIAGTRNVLYTPGRGALHYLQLERELWRSQQAIFSASAQWNHKRMRAGLEGARLHLQRPAYDSVDLRVKALWLGWASLSAQLRYSKGLGGWNANHGLRRKPPHAEEARFQAWGLGLGHNYASQTFGQAWQWNSEWELQYSDDRLPPMEVMALTGDFRVRGFHEANAFNQSGAVWNNTLTFPRRYPFDLIATPRLGFDVGIGHGQAMRSQRLAGAAIGINVRRGDLQLDLHYQHPLYHSRFTPRGGTWLAEVQARF